VTLTHKTPQPNPIMMEMELLTDFERRKRLPDFAAGTFKKNTELLVFNMPKTSHGLVPVSVEGLDKGGTHMAHNCQAFV